MKFQLKSCAALVATSLLLPVSVHADDDEMDFGLYVQKKMHDKSKKLFGIKKPLMNSAEGSVARMPGQNAYDLVEVAKGLKAKILTRDAGNKADMFSFWPNENDPSHLIFCIEGGDEVIGTLDSGLDKMNPSVQSVDLDDGSVTTILRGMNRCDGIRTTAWGSVLATEETSTGQAYEIINPLDTVNHTVIDRALGTIVTADNEVSMNVVKRDALPTMAWEGLTVLDNGVVIGGDELRPGDWDLAGDGGDDSDVDGGAIFKFVPDVAHVEGMIEKLEESPLVSGSVYAFRASCREGTSGSFTVNYGQGCEIGNGSW
ncbi:MAG: hypothetical protein AB2720_04350, partial [Candidatus Thiodiazotropha taylori]